MKEIKTLDQIKQELLKTYQKEKVLSQDQILDAVQAFDFDDKEVDDLIEWFTNQGVDLSEDAAEIDDDDIIDEEIVDDDLDILVTKADEVTVSPYVHSFSNITLILFTSYSSITSIGTASIAHSIYLTLFTCLFESISEYLISNFLVY